MPQGRKEQAGLLAAEQADLAQVFDAHGPALFKEAQEQRQACGLVFRGGHVQQPGGFVAGRALAILAQAGQQLVVIGHRAERQGKEGGWRPKARARGDNAGAGRRGLACLGLVDQGHLRPAAGQVLRCTRAHNTPAHNNHGIHR